MQVRTATRALAGMQKEALVSCGPTASVWRIVCDEGPWLNGTDLAPFPLGFFTAGLIASYMSEYLTHAKRGGIEVNLLEVQVDNHYTMEGSLLKGTMKGTALPVEVTFRCDAAASNTPQHPVGGELAVYDMNQATGRRWCPAPRPWRLAAGESVDCCPLFNSSRSLLLPGQPAGLMPVA